jgi:hypothetical protein
MLTADVSGRRVPSRSTACGASNKGQNENGLGKFLGRGGFARRSRRPSLVSHVETQNEFVAVVAEADSFEEIMQVRRRTDWRYQITCNGGPIDDRGFPILQEPGQDLTKKD